MANRRLSRVLNGRSTAPIRGLDRRYKQTLDESCSMPNDVGMTVPQQPYSPNDPAVPQPAGYAPPPGSYPPASQQVPGAPYGVDASGRPLSDKSKVVGGLLGILLGSFGVGRFYLGYTGIGIAQIAVTWLTLGIGGIWPFIDGILILLGKVPDAQGRTLRD
jgi:TM2 domain-containing membrane protein YozV